MGRLDRDVLSLLNLNDRSDLDRAQGLSKRLHRQEAACHVALHPALQRPALV